MGEQAATQQVEGRAWPVPIKANDQEVFQPGRKTGDAMRHRLRRYRHPFDVK